MVNHNLLVGQIFGRLLVIEHINSRKYIYYSCRCICGTLKEARKGDLVAGKVKSCGCLPKGFPANPKNKSYDPEYAVWWAMKRRCENSNDKAFKNYGGRGITVDPSWQSYEVFKSDMGPRPSSRYEIERVRNHEGYSKDNCVWATRLENSRNRRVTLKVPFKGTEICLIELCTIVDISYETLYMRYRRGDRGDKLIRRQRTSPQKLASTNFNFLCRNNPLTLIFSDKI